MSTVTYQGRTEGFTIPLGRDREVAREDGDFILKCTVAHDLPLAVSIQVRKDGSWRWWYTEPSLGENHYWHFSNLAGFNAETPQHTYPSCGGRLGRLSLILPLCTMIEAHNE